MSMLEKLEKQATARGVTVQEMACI
ncbi:hypothetical protein L195_g064693, partial [Trifolium pratense]